MCEFVCGCMSMSAYAAYKDRRKANTPDRTNRVAVQDQPCRYFEVYIQQDTHTHTHTVTLQYEISLANFRSIRSKTGINEVQVTTKTKLAAQQASLSGPTQESHR